MKLIYKTIYNPFINYIIRTIGLVINKTIGTKIYFPVSGIIKLKSPSSKTFRLQTNETCHVTNYIFWNGVNAYESTPLYCEIFKISKSFFDIGSNVGLFTVLAELENPSIRVDSFDPSPSSNYYTTLNAKLNNNTNTLINQLALADKKMKMTFNEVLIPKYSYLNYHLSGSSSLIPDYISNGKEYEVKTTSIDEYVEENNLTSIDFLKIDAERAEPLILKGAIKSITKFQPIIYCEVLYGMMQELDILISNPNYILFHIKNNILFSIKNPLALVYDADHDFLFVPRNKISLLNKFINTTL